MGTDYHAAVSSSDGRRIEGFGELDFEFEVSAASSGLSVQTPSIQNDSVDEIPAAM